MLNTSLPGSKELREALAVEIKLIRKRANWLLVYAFGFWSLLVLGFWIATGNVDDMAKLSTTAAYFVLFGWGAWFIYAYFLRMEAKQDVALELLMRSFAMADESNKTLQEVKNQVKPIVEDVKKVTTDVTDVVDKIRKTVDKYDSTGDLAKGFLEETKKVFSEGNGVFGDIRDKLGDLAEALKGPTGGPLANL